MIPVTCVLFFAAQSEGASQQLGQTSGELYEAGSSRLGLRNVAVQPPLLDRWETTARVIEHLR